MKITAVETYIAGNPWKNWTFVRVLTDKDVYGVGEGTFNGFAKTIEAAVHEIKHLVIGMDPFQIEAITLTLLRDLLTDGGQVHHAAAAAIEMACLDIKGKTLKVPVYELLGGKVREKIAAYANGWYRGDRNPKDFARMAKKTVADGYIALKFDPFGTAHLQMTKKEQNLAVEIVTAVREAVGPDIEVMVEAHSRFSVGEAVDICRRLESLNITWFEEPCPPTRLSDTIEVARHVQVPIASGESITSMQNFMELVEGGCIAFYQPEMMALGGLSIARHVAATVEAASGVVAPHNAQGPVSTAACLQLAACCNNYKIQEFFDAYNVEWEKDLVTWSPKLNPDGTLDIPSGPGLGIDLNLKEIAKHPYQEKNYLPLYKEDWHKREGDTK